MPLNEPSPEEADYRRTIIEQHKQMNKTIASNSFWQFNIGHAITVIVIVGGWLWYLSKAENRIGNLEMALERVVTLVEKIDEHGTTASQRGIYQETELSKANERRISSVEIALRDISPKLERIDTNLSWLLRGAPPQSK